LTQSNFSLNGLGACLGFFLLPSDALQSSNK
jgi:hypothetical protein